MSGEHFAPYDPRWAAQGAREVGRVSRALGRAAIAVHHVGATSVPDLPAMPILDVIAAAEALDQVASARLRLLGHGFEPAAPGLYVVDDPITGTRRVELRCIAIGDAEAERLPAIFALLRARPALARAYHAAKCAAWIAHAGDATAYHAAKRAWMESVLDEALAFWRSRVV